MRRAYARSAVLSGHASPGERRSPRGRYVTTDGPMKSTWVACIACYPGRAAARGIARAVPHYRTERHARCWERCETEANVALRLLCLRHSDSKLSVPPGVSTKPERLRRRDDPRDRRAGLDTESSFRDMARGRRQASDVASSSDSSHRRIGGDRDFDGRQRARRGPADLGHAAQYRGVVVAGTAGVANAHRHLFQDHEASLVPHSKRSYAPPPNASPTA